MPFGPEQTHDSINWMAPVNRDHPLNRGLVSWWLPLPNQPGWGSSRWLDLVDPLYGNAGTLTNMDGTDWGSSLRKGGSGELNFDGVSGHVSVPDNEALDLLGNRMTLSAWVYQRTNAVDELGILAKGFSGTYKYILTPRSNGNYQFALFNGSDNPVAFRGPVLLNQWVHICGTWDGTTIRLYVNGGLPSSTAAAISLTDAATTFVIGRRDSVASKYFDGMIADVRVHSRAWTTEEVGEYIDLSSRGYPGLLNRVHLPRFVEGGGGGGVTLPTFDYYYRQMRAG